MKNMTLTLARANSRATDFAVGDSIHCLLEGNMEKRLTIEEQPKKATFGTSGQKEKISGIFFTFF